MVLHRMRGEGRSPRKNQGLIYNVDTGVLDHKGRNIKVTESGPWIGVDKVVDLNVALRKDLTPHKFCVDAFNFLCKNNVSVPLNKMINYLYVVYFSDPYTVKRRTGFSFTWDEDKVFQAEVNDLWRYLLSNLCVTTVTLSNCVISQKEKLYIYYTDESRNPKLCDSNSCSFGTPKKRFCSKLGFFTD